MEWTIQEVARSAGTTSRTLRHYDEIGLLKPSRVGENGYRYYDSTSLVRLQRILLLRELGLGLPAVAELLAGEQDPAAALATHLRLLRQERDRVDRQIRSVQSTLKRVRKGEQLMVDQVFDGFDHTQYKEEVEARWGADAYRKGDRWWTSLSPEGKREFQQRQAAIAADYASAFTSGRTADSPEVQAIAARHYAWITEGWQGRRPSAEQFAGLGRMYVEDERFSANYGGTEGATLVRDAMAVYAERNL